MSLLLGQADARRIPLPDESVQAVIASPPYWGLRDYGTGQWEGGDAECSHEVGRFVYAHSEKQGSNSGSAGHKAHDICPHCGARRIDRQIGLEQSPDEYVAQMVAVFREVRRVLRSDGTAWLVIGDSFSSGMGNTKSGMAAAANRLDGGNRRADVPSKTETVVSRKGTIVGLPPKNLCMIPARVALALRADGWWLRSQIIWAKGVSFCPTYSGSVMPESVRDRPTQSYEHVFLLAKSRIYYYDAEAVKELSIYPDDNRKARAQENHKRMPTEIIAGMRPGSAEYPTRNLRSVWTINPKPSRLAHYAAFPPALVEPMVLAGTSAKGCCPECGKPWERLVEKSPWKLPDGSCGCGTTHGTNRSVAHLQGPQGMARDGRSYCVQSTTTGWRPGCTCGAGLEPQPCKILDPFGGTMTVGEVCAKHGRHFVGLGLKREYVEMGRERCASVQIAMAL